MARRGKEKPPGRGRGIRTFGTPTFESRFHLEDIVRGADGERYRLRLARTGIHRRLWGAPINNILNDISWIRYFLKTGKSWTLTVEHRGDWGDRTILSETFADREQGAVRAEGLVDLLRYDPTLATACARRAASPTLIAESEYDLAYARGSAHLGPFCVPCRCTSSQSSDSRFVTWDSQPAMRSSRSVWLMGRGREGRHQRGSRASPSST